MKKLAAVALVVAGALGLPALATPAAAAPLIQPGEYSESAGAGCTLNFVYDGTGAHAGKVFVGTAAHCVPGVGAPVADSDGTVFGDVAAIGDEDATETDWALVQVRAGHVGRVSPAVKGHPGYPTGVSTSTQTAVLDPVQGSGYGIVFSVTALTREERPAVLTYDDAEVFTTLGASIFGDSGGPLVHVPTGRALGIVSRLCIGTCEMEGPTVEGILAKAAAQGFTVSLRTV